MSKIVDMSGVPGGSEEMNFIDGEVHSRSDGAQAMYQELTRIETDVVQEKYRRKSGLILVPIKPDLDISTEKITHQYVESEGEAAVVNGLDPTVPSVNSSMHEVEIGVKDIVMGYKVNHKAIAARDRLALDRAKLNAEACQKAIWKKIDRILIHGDTALQIPSLLEGEQAIETIDLRDGDGNIMVITEDINPDKLSQIIQKMAQRLALKTDDQFEANKLALPNKLRKLLARKRMPDSSISVGQYVAANLEHLKSFDDIVGVPEFNENYQGKGADSPPLSTALAYDMDPSVIRANILAPRQHYVKRYPFGHFVIWTGRTTPALWRQPMGGVALRFRMELDD